MKHWLGVFTLVLIGLVAGSSLVQAQQFPPLPGDSVDYARQAAVAFEKAPRNKIFVKVPGGQLDSLDFSGDPTEIDSIRQVTLIGERVIDANTVRLLIGATLYYKNPSSGNHVVYTGLLNVPPVLTRNILQVTGPSGVQFVLGATQSGFGFRPTGRLSADGSQWWAAFSTSSQGSQALRFYHGSMDGGSVDSVEVTAAVAGHSGPLNGGYHVSNISIDNKNGYMFSTSFDGMDDPFQSGRALLYVWRPGAQLLAKEYTATLKSGAVNSGQGRGKLQQLDSIFGLTVNAVGDGSTVEVGITNYSSDENNIELYTGQYTAANYVPQAGRSIPRASLPDTTWNFYAGINCGQYNETNSMGGQLGEAGDVSFSPGGDTAYFTTHEHPDNCGDTARTQLTKSGIWMYDFGGQAKLIYNDTTAKELSPVFIPQWLSPVPHTPTVSSPSSVDFKNVDTGKTLVKTITLRNTSIYAGTVIDSIRLKNGTNFSITTAPTLPYTLNREQSVDITVTFAPPDAGGAGARTDSLIIKSARLTPSTIRIPLLGTATIPKDAVAEDAALSAGMSVEPNPFSTSTSVRLTAPDAGTLGIVVHDALGRQVFTSEVRRVGAGASEAFTFDAKSLGLPNGVYYVTALFGGREASRQVVFVR